MMAEGYDWKQAQEDRPESSEEKIDRLQAENQRIREALQQCRTSYCGYNVRDHDDAIVALRGFSEELERISNIARAALEAK